MSFLCCFKGGDTVENTLPVSPNSAKTHTAPATRSSNNTPLVQPGTSVSELSNPKAPVYAGTQHAAPASIHTEATPPTGPAPVRVENVSLSIKARAILPPLRPHTLPRPLTSRAAAEVQSQAAAIICYSNSLPSDVWSTVQEFLDFLCNTLPVTTVSLVAFTSNAKFARVVHSTSINNLPPFVECPDGQLLSASLVGAAAASSFTGEPIIMTVQSEYQIPALFTDLLALRRSSGCSSFMVVPLCLSDCAASAVLIFAHTEQTPQMEDPGYVSCAMPVLEAFLVERRASKLCDAMERATAAASLNALACSIAVGLRPWFTWCHPDDMEVRLVLVGADQSSALTAEAVSDSPRMMSHPNRSPPPHLPGVVSTATASQTMLGTEMALSNTLTRRTMVEGARLLLVPDVLQALKKYGDPWQDVFLDAARISNPCWVLLAPLMQGKRMLGAVMWLSSTRLNASKLADEAQHTIPGLMETLAEQVARFLPPPVAPHSSSTGSGSGNGSGNGNGEGGAGGYAAGAAPSPSWAQLMALSEPPPTVPRKLSTEHMYASDGLGSSVEARPFVMSQQPVDSRTPQHLTAADLAGRVKSYISRGGSSVADQRSIRLTRTYSTSTNALVRLYSSAIAQQRFSMDVSDSGAPAYEELQLLAKAGRGASGTVYVAQWRGLVVAVKIMKGQGESRQAMRNAWELAVVQSMAHSSIVNVHSVLADVAIHQVSRDLIRLMPVSAVQNGSAANSRGPSFSGSYTSLGNSSTGHGKQPDPSRHQVIIMEYCSMGALNQFIAERALLRPSGTHSSSRTANAGTGRGAAMFSRLFPPLQAGDSCDSDPRNQDMASLLTTLTEIATAMVYLHLQGLVHCDLKPGNILLKASPEGTRGFVAKVSDFGFSEQITARGPMVGEMGGTVTHVAPEVVLHKQISAADVFAFGIIMWEIYTGQKPFAALAESMPAGRERSKMILSKIAVEQVRPEWPLHSPLDYMVRRSGAAPRCPDLLPA
ncbi:MAG: hypothetical protein WDW38_011305, partial [Sanguina aurantia]